MDKEKSFWSSVKRFYSSPWIGKGHGSAWLRGGAKELTQILPAFPSHGVQPVEEPGLLGNPTAQIVTQEIGGLTGYQAMLEGYAAKAHEHKQPEKGQER